MHHGNASRPGRAGRRLLAGQLAAGSTFVLGAAGYGLLELLWRGHTHWTMLLTGGACLCGLRRVSRCMLPLPTQCALGSGLITGVELLVGLLCNRALHWNVWDYSGHWGNLLGQICPLYSFFWFLLCIPVLALLRAADPPRGRLPGHGLPH